MGPLTSFTFHPPVKQVECTLIKRRSVRWGFVFSLDLICKMLAAPRLSLRQRGVVGESVVPRREWRWAPTRAGARGET